MSGEASSAPRNSAEDVKVLVSFLKQAPFSRPFTLVSFSQQSPLDLLQLTNDLFASLDPRQQRDLRDEPSDLTTHRMIDFLITTLSYQPPSLPSPSSPEQLAAFGSSFISAAPATVYPVLLYVLSNYESLKKRVYLSQFLSTPAVPPDMLSDPTIASLLASYAQRQEEFKELHRTTEAVREGALHVSGLKKDVEQLESEREQLRTKMKRLTQRVEADEETASGSAAAFSSMLRLTNQLRLEQEEEQKLAQQRDDQRTRLEELRKDIAHLSKQYDDLCRYHAVSKDSHSAPAVNPLQLLARMKAEVKDEADEVERVLEVELLDKEKTLKHMQKAVDALGPDVHTADDVDDLKAKVSDLERQVQRMEADKQRLIGGSESQLGFLYDRLSAVQKKAEKAEAKLKEVDDEVDEARMDRDKAEAELDVLLRQRSDDERDGVPRGGKELKRYMEALAAKTARYKELKAQLDVGYAELGVLQSTFNTLKARVVNQQDLNAQLEKAQGVEGWREQESRLVDFTKQNRAMDDQKAETLEEISALVDQIDAQIKAKKNTLAPSIKELRQVRGQYEALDADYRAGKDVHEKIGLRYESERLKLEAEVREREEEKEKTERGTWRARVEERMLKVREEGLKDRAAAKAYQDEVERSVKALEKREKALKKEKKAMNDNGNAYVNQRALFKNLQLILSTKEAGTLGKTGTDTSQKDRLVF